MFPLDVRGGGPTTPQLPLCRPCIHTLPPLVLLKLSPWLWLPPPPRGPSLSRFSFEQRNATNVGVLGVGEKPRNGHRTDPAPGPTSRPTCGRRWPSPRPLPAGQLLPQRGVLRGVVRGLGIQPELLLPPGPPRRRSPQCDSDGLHLHMGGEEGGTLPCGKSSGIKG